MAHASTKKKVTKVSKPKAPSQHPDYKNMIQKALTELKDRKGSSRQAIIKYIKANFKIGVKENVDLHVRMSLRNGIKSERYVQVKGTGASGSFKLSDSAKKIVKPSVKKALKPKSMSPKKKSPKKTAAKSKSVVSASGDNTKAKKITKPNKVTTKKSPSKKPAKPKTKSPKKKVVKNPKVKTS